MLPISVIVRVRAGDHFFISPEVVYINKTSTTVLLIRIGFDVDRIHLFTSMWIRIQGAKLIWIHADLDLDLDPGQVYLLILVYFLAPEF